MKNLKTFDEFLTEASQIQANDYSLKEVKFQSLKPTWSLQLTKSGWEKVKHLFNENGTPISKDVEYNINGYIWKLLIDKPYKIHNNITNEETVMYRVYGTCGDYTFGGAPTYYKSSLSGNKKTAKKVYDLFINEFLK